MNYEGNEVETVLNKNDYYAHNLKAKAMEMRIDRISEAAKKADTFEDKKRFDTLRSQSEKIYNKYRQHY